MTASNKGNGIIYNICGSSKRSRTLTKVLIFTGMDDWETLVRRSH